MIKLELKGMAELNAKLQELDVQLAAKVVRAAARKAFAPVLEAAKSKVPVDTGNLRDSIKLATTKPKQGDTLVAAGLVVVNQAKKGRKTKETAAGEQRDPYYWRFVEKGTSSQGARPFLRPALDANTEAVIEGLTEELRKGIDKAVKKGGKK